jgi:formylglycine-generating enzyme required for sulfatase activity
MPEFADPDLIMQVSQETLADGRTALEFVVKARFDLHLRKFPSEPFRGEPREHFSRLFRDLNSIGGGGSDWLAGRGVQLFEELLPLELQRCLWSLLGSVRTIHIPSDEVWIPWELLRLRDPDDSASCGPFLVEAFSVTRWLSEVRSPATQLFPLRRIALVVPRDSTLAHGSLEAQEIKALGSATREVIEIPATLREVEKALASGMYDGWHFAGHGACGSSSHLLLENGEELSPAVLYGEARRLGLGKPLVFLNSCGSGHGTVSLTSVDGLASAFIKAGAGAFIGAQWDLRDEQACWFATWFYRQLFAGVAIGEAVSNARLELRSRFPESNAWLAFTVFAHPLARHSAVAAARPSKTPRRSRASRPVPAARTAEPTARPQESSPPDQPELLVSEPRKVAAPAPGEERIHPPDGTVLVLVPGGEITLGAEGINPWSTPLRRVRLNPFWIGKLLVTNQQYSCFLDEHPAFCRPAFWADPRLNQPQHPVVGVSWDEAQAYCRWAGLELPSEAQWEAAARGADRRPYPWGKELPTSRHANFGGAMGGTTPVGAYPAGAGPYGTLDQAGNVWEWCADHWVSKIYRQIEDGQWDPVATGEPTVRSLRGGSWMNPPQDLRAACRERGTAKLRFSTQGFRCVWRPA